MKKKILLTAEFDICKDDAYYENHIKNYLSHIKNEMEVIHYEIQAKNYIY